MSKVAETMTEQDSRKNRFRILVSIDGGGRQAYVHAPFPAVLPTPRHIRAALLSPRSIFWSSKTVCMRAASCHDARKP